MLADPLLQYRYVRHLDSLISLAHKELERTRWQPEFHALAQMYLDGFCRARILSFDTLRILCKGDTHVHVEAWWAVANKIRPINIGPEQPSSCVQGCSGSYLRHAFSLARHTASNKRTHMPHRARRQKIRRRARMRVLPAGGWLQLL